MPAIDEADLYVGGILRRSGQNCPEPGLIETVQRFGPGFHGPGVYLQEVRIANRQPHGGDRIGFIQKIADRAFNDKDLLACLDLRKCPEVPEFQTTQVDVESDHHELAGKVMRLLDQVVAQVYDGGHEGDRDAENQDAADATEIAPPQPADYSADMIAPELVRIDDDLRSFGLRLDVLGAVVLPAVFVGLEIGSEVVLVLFRGRIVIARRKIIVIIVIIVGTECVFAVFRAGIV